MSVIRLGGFRGEIPRTNPRFLPEGAAQTALNMRADSGALEAVRAVQLLKPATTLLALPRALSSLFRYSDTVWLEAEYDTDWVPYPVTDDQYGRVIFADSNAGELRVTDASLVGAGGYPSNYRRLDVPPPTQGFAATLNGTADDATEVPETRYYVCTFVNNWGAEGPPSPASNQVEWRSGQTVTLSSLPSVPAGNYNITHRRIYRINTGSTGVTNYQFVSEVAVSVASASITAISQTNPVKVTTATAHGLTDGQEVAFSGLGLGATQNITAITKAIQAQVTVPGHGLATSEVVEFQGLGSGNGMDPLDNTREEIFYINVDKFELPNVNSISYPTYITGGTVAQVFGMDELNGNQYFVAVIDDNNFTLESVDGSGYKAYVQGGSVNQIAGNSYVDAVPSASLAEVLPTELYDPPNSATVGIKQHPAGFLVGFFGKTVAFSEPGAPHAWPIDYRQSTNHDIVALGVYGNTVVVTTKGWPYLVVGSDPSAMQMIELEIEQSCASKRGVVDFGTAIAYPSPDGLILVSPSGVQNVSASIFNREQWQALVPSSFVAFNWEQQYLCFYADGVTQRAFIINPFAPDMGVRYITYTAVTGYKDIEEDILYIVRSNNIEKWDQSSTLLSYTWKSKPVYTPHAVNMAAAKVIADAYPVEVEFYSDEVRRYAKIVGSIDAFRLPGGFKGEKFEVVIKGSTKVTEVVMATTMSELSVTI